MALAYLLSLAAALFLIFRDSPSDFKTARLLLIIFLPVAGAVLYFLSIGGGGKKGESVVYPPAGCEGLEYFDNGADYLNRLNALVLSAKSRVYLEYYILAKGRVWCELRESLEAVLARGVTVKIIYDGLGSALRAPVKDLKRLRKLGAQIKIFNKLRPLPFSRINLRDHRKIACIDDRAVFLGGVNIADEYANLTAPHGYWKDGGALFYGQIAAQYAEIFLSAFEGIKHRTPPDIPQPTGNLTLVPVADRPLAYDAVCENLLAGAIYSARERVYILTPYLCTGEKLTDALAYAAKNGADVKIIIPRIPDKKLTYAITRSYCERLQKSGIEVYTYTPGFMHFKGVVCDNRALLGSYNFDYRSMRLNYECGVCGGGELCDELTRDFLACLAVSRGFVPKRGLSALSRRLLCLIAPLV